MVHFRPLLIATLTVLTGQLAAQANPKINFADPPEGTFADEWYAVMLNGAKAGHLHSTMKRTGDIISSTEDMEIVIQRAGIKIPMAVAKTTRETLKGKPLAIKTETKMATVAVVHSARIDGEKVTVTSRQLGPPQTATYRIPQTYRLVWGTLLLQEKHGLKPGTTYSADTYDPSLSPSKVIPTKVTIGQPRVIDLFGRKVEAVETTGETKFLGTSMSTQAFLSLDGTPVKMSMPLAGTAMTLEIIQCPKAFALRESSAPEMFLSSLIPVDRRLDRDKMQTGRYRLSLKDDGGSQKIPPLPNTDMQTAQAAGDEQTIVRVARSDHAALARVPAGEPNAADKEYLRASVFLNHKDPAVRKLANAARGNAEKPYELADRLRKHVSTTVVTKDLNVGFATAGEVARSKQGDCSEHAVLLAAMGRASGLPSRVVSGIIFVKNFAARKNVFGFHMWTQFKIGGKWIDFDAAQDQTDCDPTHIALAVSPLNDEGLADVSLSLLTLIGRVEVDILDPPPPADGP